MSYIGRYSRKWERWTTRTRLWIPDSDTVVAKFVSFIKQFFIFRKTYVIFILSLHTVFYFLFACIFINLKIIYYSSICSRSFSYNCTRWCSTRNGGSIRNSSDSDRSCRITIHTGWTIFSPRFINQMRPLYLFVTYFTMTYFFPQTFVFTFLILLHWFISFCIIKVKPKLFEKISFNFHRWPMFFKRAFGQQKKRILV